MSNLLNILMASMDAMRTTLAANTEAVLHDLTQPECSVISIVNGHVSGRKPGDPLLSGPNDDVGFLGLLEPAQRVPSRVFNNYKTTTSSGKVLNSASTIYYSEDGVPLVAFCINVDLDVVNSLKRTLDSLLPTVAEQEAEDMSDKIPAQSFDEVIARFRQTGSENKIQFRKRVVAELQKMGFFKVKGSVGHIAHALGVSRYTIYNYLEKNDEKQ